MKYTTTKRGIGRNKTQQRKRNFCQGKQQGLFIFLIQKANEVGKLFSPQLIQTLCPINNIV